MFVHFTILSHTKGNPMPMKPDASICEAGRKYYLRNATFTNADIALHLTGNYLVTADDDMGGESQPPGTFWIQMGNTKRRLAAVRTTSDEIVVLYPFLSSLGQAMLAIADFATENNR